MTGRIRRAAIVGLLGAVACAGSGGPVEIPPEEVPFPLQREVSSTPPGVVEHSFRVMLVKRRRLVEVKRTETSALPVEELAVRTLLQGPTTTESERGLTSAIPSTARILSVQVFDGVAEVNLSQGFQAAASSEGFLLRVAQIVTTLTGLEGITAVRISIDGEVAAVPTGQNEIVLRPVTAADYQSRLNP